MSLHNLNSFPLWIGLCPFGLSSLPPLFPEGRLHPKRLCLRRVDYPNLIIKNSELAYLVDLALSPASQRKIAAFVIH